MFQEFYESSSKKIIFVQGYPQNVTLVTILETSETSETSVTSD